MSRDKYYVLLYIKCNQLGYSNTINENILGSMLTYRRRRRFASADIISDIVCEFDTRHLLFWALGGGVMKHGRPTAKTAPRHSIISQQFWP